MTSDPGTKFKNGLCLQVQSQAGQMIYELLKEISKERSVVVVTHAEVLAQMANTVLHIKDGRIQNTA